MIFRERPVGLHRLSAFLRPAGLEWGICDLLASEGAFISGTTPSDPVILRLFRSAEKCDLDTVLWTVVAVYLRNRIAFRLLHGLCCLGVKRIGRAILAFTDKPICLSGDDAVFAVRHPPA